MSRAILIDKRRSCAIIRRHVSRAVRGEGPEKAIPDAWDSLPADASAAARDQRNERRRRGDVPLANAEAAFPDASVISPLEDFSRADTDAVTCLHEDGHWQIVGPDWIMSPAGPIDDLEAERICRLAAQALSQWSVCETGGLLSIARQFCRVRNRVAEGEPSPCAGRPVCHRCAEEARTAVVTARSAGDTDGSA